MEFLAELHSSIVHFPIAILILYALFEILGAFVKREMFSQTAYILLVLGVLTALAAVLTGNQASQLAELWIKNGASFSENAIEHHEEFATLTLWYFFSLLILRTFFVVKKKFDRKIKYIFILLALVGCFLIYETGAHGGELVYKYGIGTEPVKPKIIE